MPTDDGFEEWFDSTGLTNAKEMSATFDAGNEYAAFKMLIRAAWQAAVKHERERCAGVVTETDVLASGSDPSSIIRQIRDQYVAAIRGGGDNS